jgi:hypothetical protein
VGVDGELLVEMVDVRIELDEVHNDLLLGVKAGLRTPVLTGK